jgi:hypothetical protein
MEDRMAKTRTFSISATLGLALLTMASPANAYIVGALTSIRAEDAADNATLEKAIRAAVNDVATHAVAFTPTMVSLREAKLVGDRIYLLVLLADQAGEKELEVLNAGTEPPDPDLRRNAVSPASRLRRHPYALGALALLIAVVAAGTLATTARRRSQSWRYLLSVRAGRITGQNVRADGQTLSRNASQSDRART